MVIVFLLDTILSYEKFHGNALLCGYQGKLFIVDAQKATLDRTPSLSNTGLQDLAQVFKGVLCLIILKRIQNAEMVIKAHEDSRPLSMKIHFFSYYISTGDYFTCYKMNLSLKGKMESGAMFINLLV